MATSLPGFAKISGRTYLYEPSLREVSQDAAANLVERFPTTILICGWADAKPRHISKYSDVYRELYPSSRIVIVTAGTLSIVFGGQAGASGTVKDMVVNDLYSQTLSGLAEKTDGKEHANESLLIHAFSNSGNINLEAACHVYKAITRTDEPMPHTALVLDSSPGGAFFWKDLSRWSMAVTAGAGGNLPWPTSVTLCLAYLWFAVTIGIPMLFGQQNIVARSREALNNPQIFSRDAHRLYLYSEKDPLIDFRDVEDHAAEAAAKGYTVHVKKFSDSTHCGHARVYGQEYWAAIESLWDDAISSST